MEVEGVKEKLLRIRVEGSGVARKMEREAKRGRRRGGGSGDEGE